MTDKERVLYQFDSYISTIYLSPDSSGFCFDKYPKIYYLNLKSGDKEPQELVKEYYSLNGITFHGNKIGVIYQPNWQSILATSYEDGKLLWKETLNKGYIYSSGMGYAGEEDNSILLLEINNGSILVHVFEDEATTNFSIKAIRNITFQYPLLAYAWGTKELWVQDLNNNVSIYYFDSSI